MNEYYSYPNLSLWYLENWSNKINALYGLVRKIGELPEERNNVDADERYQGDPEVVKTLPGYQYKSGSYDDPAVVAYWDSRNVVFQSREGGTMRSVTFMPKGAKNGELPLLVVFHKEDYGDPYWALKTLDLFAPYCEDVAAKLSYGIWFIVTNNMPDVRRSYAGMLKYDMTDDVDQSRIYLDLTLFRRHGLSLKDLTDFRYVDDSGNPVEDPETAVQRFENYPVLNISNRFAEYITPTFTSVTTEGQQDGTIDFEAIYHSETGKKMMEAIALEYYYDSVEAPEVQRVFQEMGLRYESHTTQGQSWYTFVPMNAKADSKLPLLVVFCGKQAPLTSVSFYFRYLQIASQGECAVLFQSGATLPENDIPYQIVLEAQSCCPVDPRRLYVSGHSHWGHISQLFMRRYPNLVTAAAPLGNTPGIPLPEGSGEVILVSDEDIEQLSKVDMPLVIVSGCCEAGCMFPVCKAAKGFDPGINVDGFAASVEGRCIAWNRRLKSCGCQERTQEEIEACAGSANKATRELGVPSDRAETVYMDGFEHYVADFRNKDGKTHFRIIGEQNMPHVATPSQLELAWSFLRRFARDTQTGEIIECI